MRDFLELEEEDTPIGFFILGKPDESFQRPKRTRIAASDKTEWIRK
jgi:hypothetical protein